MISSHAFYETPEGINIKLAVAGPMVRAVAWNIDLTIRIVIYIVAAIVASYLDKVGDGLMLIGIFLLEWLYPTVFEAWKGATPGKKYMGIYVAMEDGSGITWQASLVRNLLRTVDFLPFCYVIGLFSTLLNRQFKRIGDWVAGTVVLYAHAPQAKQAEATEESLAPKPLSIPLTADEQRLILEFVDRCPNMSPSRQLEMASILSPVLRVPDQEAVQTLKQNAAWIKGKHL